MNNFYKWKTFHWIDLIQIISLLSVSITSLIFYFAVNLGTRNYLCLSIALLPTWKSHVRYSWDLIFLSSSRLFRYFFHTKHRSSDFFFLLAATHDFIRVHKSRAPGRLRRDAHTHVPEKKRYLQISAFADPRSELNFKRDGLARGITISTGIVSSRGLQIPGDTSRATRHLARRCS